MGWLHVDEMLDEMTPEEFEERWQHYLLEPWGDHWEMAGTVAAAVNNTMTRYILAKAGKSHVPQNSMYKPDDFIPRLRLEDSTQKGTINADDEHAAEKLAKQLGCI